MNKGIKKSSTCKVLEVGNAGTIQINLYKNELGTYIIIPIYTTSGYENITYSLIYSTYNKNIETNYGYGIRDNLYKEFNSNKPVLKVIDSDGSITEYIYEKTENEEEYYKNEEEKEIVIKNETSYKIKTIDGSYLEYQLNTTYPKIVRNKEREIVNLPNESGYGNFGGYQLINSGTNKYTQTKFIKNEEIIYQVKYEYNENGKLNKIKHYQIKDNELEYLYTNEYEFSDSTIKVVDGMTGYYVELTGTFIEDRYIINKITEGYKETNIKKESQISYDVGEINLTRITEKLDNKEIKIDYQFKNDHLNYIIDNDGKMSYYEYNGNQIITQSKDFFCKYEDNSANTLICDYFYKDTISTWKTEDETEIEIIDDYNITYQEIFGTKALMIDKKHTTSGKKSVKRGTYLTLKIFNRKYTGTGKLNIKIKTGDTLEETYTIENSDTRYKVNIIQIKTSRAGTPKIEIEPSSNTKYWISTIILKEEYILEKYTYDGNYNLIKKEYGPSKIEYKYNDEGIIETIQNYDKMISYIRDENKYLSLSNGVERQII